MLSATKLWSESGSRLSPPRLKKRFGAIRVELTWTPIRQSPMFSMPNEDLSRVAFGYGRPYRRHASMIVDRPLHLSEIPAPFTSRLPGIATFGPSCTPDRQLS